MKYKFLEHKADAKFQAFGRTIEEAFQNAALAMTSIMIEPEKVKPKTRHKIKVKGIDLKNLLYNFLEEILFLVDTKYFILHNAKVRINKLQLTAELAGDNLQNYETKSHIKAVTYNEMIVQEKPGKAMVQVVCDI